MAILKMDSTNSIVWQSVFEIQPLYKGLTVDSAEQYFYFAIGGANGIIVRSDTSNGAYNSGIQL